MAGRRAVRIGFVVSTGSAVVVVLEAVVTNYVTTEPPEWAQNKLVVWSVFVALAAGSVTLQLWDRRLDNGSGPAAEPRGDAASGLLDAADQLAQSVSTRWQREQEQQRILDPVPLTVRWQRAAEELTDSWENICRVESGESAAPLDLAGHLDQVVDVYRRTPSGRLVVLGRAGSGKTILTVRFVLNLLRNRTPTDPVPVIFSLGSWNPTTTSLRDWLAGQLVRDHPGLGVPGSGRPTLAAALVEADRILPVLDGFDEIADGLHRAALDALNRTTALPFLITSRRTEYQDAVERTDVLSSAAGIELTDLTVEDVTNYLPRTTRRTVSNDTDTTTPLWEPVLNSLHRHPQTLAGHNLTEALSTPLMVALVRTIYSDTPDHNPSVLLDSTRFSTPGALQDHLLDNFIPTVYRPDYRPAAPRRAWDPERAGHWLGRLAGQLDHLGTRDLAWWRLGTTMHRSARMLVVGLTIALAVTPMLVLVYTYAYAYMDAPRLEYEYGRTSGLELGLRDGILNGLSAGAAFGIMHGFMPWLQARFGIGAPSFEPSRVHIRIRGGAGRVRESFVLRFVVGLVGGILFGVVFGLGYAVSLVFQGLPSAAIMYGFVKWVITGLTLGIMLGPVYALMAAVEVPIDIRSSGTPADLLHTNRATVLSQSLVVGLVFGLGYGLLSKPEARSINGLSTGFMIAVGYGLSMTAWGRWAVLARIWLPLTGQLPWAVNAFLDDAYQRGVLRQAGAVYQFRHARLQDRLAQAVPTNQRPTNHGHQQSSSRAALREEGDGDPP